MFLYDRDTATVRRISVRSDGGQAANSSYSPAISADGRWVTFYSLAENLVDGDTNGATDVFLYDRDSGLTRRVSVRSDGGQANGGSYDRAISANGRWIAYASYATNLVDNDTNGIADVFLFDRATGSTQRVSVRSDGGQANDSDSALEPAISADGRWIAYNSIATNLVDNDTNGVRDVFLFDRDTSTTRRVSVRSDGGQATGQDSEGPAVSGDGRWITYWSYAANLVDGDTNAASDVFLYDRDTGTTRRVSVRSNGAQATDGSYEPAISADGRWISCSSYATNLVDNDTNGMADVFLFDRDTGTTQRVSVRSNGAQASNVSIGPAISSEGRWIAYTSAAADLVDNDTNGMNDVFLSRMW